MTLHSELPIYNDIMFILKDLYRRVPKFSKQYKYILGEKMLECPINSLVLVQKISDCRDKNERIECVVFIQEEINRLLVYVRLANELEQFSNKKSYFFVAENVVNVLNQAKNWKKFLQKK
jgi:hypothetical protein